MAEISVGSHWRADNVAVAVAVAVAVSEEDGKPTLRVKVMNYSPECQHQQLMC